MKTALLNEAFLFYTIPPNETDFLSGLAMRVPLNTEEEIGIPSCTGR